MRGPSRCPQHWCHYRFHPIRTNPNIFMWLRFSSILFRFLHLYLLSIHFLQFIFKCISISIHLLNIFSLSWDAHVWCILISPEYYITSSNSLPLSCFSYIWFVFLYQFGLMFSFFMFIFASCHLFTTLCPIIPGYSLWCCIWCSTFLGLITSSVCELVICSHCSHIILRILYSIQS